MSQTIDRARWRIADLLDRIPGLCWANLVSWVLRQRDIRDTRQDWMCREDADNCGRCWCGKLRLEGEK